MNDTLKKSKILFVIISVLFIVLLIYFMVDFSKKTNFPGQDNGNSTNTLFEE